MFQFTTTTVINKLKDFTTGKDLITTTGSGDDAVISIKRHNPFKVKNIDCIYKAVHVDPKADTVTVSGLAAQATDKRVALYIRSIGNADPGFSNGLVFKGKPLYIEVPANTAAADLATVAQKYLNLVFGGSAQLVATVSGTDLVLTCTNPYQRITKATVASRDAETNEFGDGATTGAVIATGNEGFGDYDHLLKDLRLPTGANLRWKRTMEDEMPIPGTDYDQYTLYYTVDRGIMGLGAVGAKTTSMTTHVFWVNSAIAADFETAIAAAASKLTQVKTQAETAAGS